MDVSFRQVVKQNTLGQSEGAPVGVPRSYNWFKGWNNDGKKIPPANFTAVEGWGQVYQRIGADAYSSPTSSIEVANAKTYVRLKGGGWTLVQDQTKSQVVGGHFVPGFQNNAGHPMTMVPRGDDVIGFNPPSSDYNDHFWFGSRGTYAPGSIDGVYVQMDIRVTDAKLDLIAMVGADWWRDARAPYLQDHSNNPGAGSSNWIKLSTEWSTLGFYSSTAVKLHADPPPPLIVSARETPRAVSRDATLSMSPAIVSFSPDTGPIGDGVTSANVLTLVGRAFPGNVVKIFDGDRQIGLATANDNGVWNFLTGRLKVGKHSFVVKGEESQSGSEVASIPMAVKIDVARSSRPLSLSVPDRASLVKGSFEVGAFKTRADTVRVEHLDSRLMFDVMSSVSLMLLLVMAGANVKRRSRT
jgi:hypothetical protein